MPLGLSPRETTTSFDALSQMPTAVEPPVSGSEIALENIEAPFKGIAGGAAATYEAAASAATSAFANLALKPLQERALQAGAAGMAVPESSVVELDPDTVQRDQAIASTKVIQQFASDPRRSGVAAQVLNSVASGGVRFVGGTLLTGSPVGGAALVGATEGMNTRDTLITNGVDKDAADKLALGSAMFSGGAALLPGGVGKTLMTRVLSGSGIQLTAGIANRTMMHVGLEDAGYADMAKQYVPLDGAGMMADAILGSVFGAVHHAFAPELVDSAHAIKDAEHVEDAARGPATSPESRDAILYNDTRGAEALIAGHDLTGTRDVETVPNPAQDAAREAATREVDAAAAEAGARRVEALVEPETPEAIVKAVTDRVEAEQEAAGSTLGRGARQAEAAKAEGDALATLDPETRETLDQAKAVLEQREGMKVGGEDGTEINASDALRRAIDDIKESAGEDDLHRVAAACFGRA
jgi:hypothetical protein